MGCRTGWLFRGNFSLELFAKCEYTALPLCFVAGRMWVTFHAGEVYQSLPDDCWSSVRLLTFGQKK